MIAIVLGAFFLALLVGSLLADWRSYRRRTSFERVLERAHPGLARTLVRHAGDVRPVAWRAVDVHTPAAPRALADQELR